MSANSSQQSVLQLQVPVSLEALCVRNPSPWFAHAVSKLVEVGGLPAKWVTTKIAVCEGVTHKQKYLEPIEGALLDPWFCQLLNFINTEMIGANGMVAPPAPLPVKDEEACPGVLDMLILYVLYVYNGMEECQRTEEVRRTYAETPEDLLEGCDYFRTHMDKVIALAENIQSHPRQYGFARGPDPFWNPRVRIASAPIIPLGSSSTK